MDVITTQGMHMPRLGLGTFKMKGAECTEAVSRALGLGYRHIDTAEMYDNEAAVGEGMARSGVARGEVHLTTKAWHDHLAPAAIRDALHASLDRLRQDHVDLYLIHWPSPAMDLPATLEAMMRLREEGRTRAIGVANFTVALLRQAVEEVRAPIACNQVEYHVGLGQDALLGYARSVGVPLVAYCPIGQGRLADSEALSSVAAKHGVSTAQVALRWLLDQDGVAAIPKASRAQSQQANLDALKVSLDDEDRAAIAALPKDGRLVKPAFAPNWD